MSEVTFKKTICSKYYCTFKTFIKLIYTTIFIIQIRMQDKYSIFLGYNNTDTDTQITSHLLEYVKSSVLLTNKLMGKTQKQKTKFNMKSA